MLNTLNDDSDLLKKVVTGDVSWVYGYVIETNGQSLQWKRPEEPKLKKALQVGSNVKVLLIVFFDCGRTVNKEYNLEIMCSKFTTVISFTA